MTTLFFFLFGCIAGALLCRQGPQGHPGPPGPVARDVDPSGALYPVGHNLAHRQRVLDERVHALEKRIEALNKFGR